MKFLCGSCRTKYQISDEKVRGKILTIRCKKCGAKIVVRESLARDASGGTAVAPVAEEEKAVAQVQSSPKKVARVGGSAALASAYEVAMGSESNEADDMPTSIAPVPANLDIAGVEWYVAIDGTQHGPFAFAELVRKLEHREVIARHYVWHDGMDNWKRVRDVPDLNQYVPAAPKKKPPPPPPVSVETKAPRGADIVDIAAKRAERARQSPRIVEDDVGDDDRTAVETAGPLARAAQATSPTSSDRAEQLDVVLNEALGIEGEGQTTRAEPTGAVAHGAAKATVESKEPTPSIEDLLAFEAKEDDIFANLPRADEEEDVVRESTRFFVAAAGVNQKRKRNRMGLIVGLSAGALVAAFVGAWASGIIEIKIPGIGNPFANSTSDATEEIAVAPGGEDEDFEWLLKGKTKTRVRRKKPIRKKKTTNGDTGFIKDDPTGALAGTRGDTGPEGFKMDPLRTSGPGGQIGVGDTQLPSSNVSDVPVPDRAGSLSADDIQKVIGQQTTAVSFCFQQSLRAKEDLGGKIEFRVTVQPSGRVSRAAVATTAFSGSKLANCIARKIKNWRFPKFTGDDQQIIVPFILQRQKY